MSLDPPASTLLALFHHPVDDPPAWAAAVGLGVGATAILKPPGHPQTGPDTEPPAWPAAVRRLQQAGVATVGHVSLGYGARPVREVAADVTRWAGHRVNGVFFDHAPTGRRRLDQVVLALRAAHHSGLDRIILNAAGPVDPLYRRLNATICTFEGVWSDYLAWSGAEAERGDGHLVFGVPRSECQTARALAVARGAGLYLIAEHTDAYSAPVAAPARGTAVSATSRR